MYQHVKVPAAGQKITVNKDFSLAPSVVAADLNLDY